MRWGMKTCRDSVEVVVTVLAGELDPASVRDQPADSPKEARLTRTVRSDDANEFTPADSTRDIGKGNPVAIRHR